MSLYGTQLNVVGLGFQQTFVAERRCLTVSGALYVENDAAARQESCELAPLKASHFPVIRSNDKRKNVEGRAQFSNVVGVAAENDPAHAGPGSSTSHVRKSGGSGGLEYDDIGAAFGGALYALQELLALENAVVLCTENLKIRAGACGRLTRTIHLLDLEIVVFVRYREQETRLGQEIT